MKPGIGVGISIAIAGLFLISSFIPFLSDNAQSVQKIHTATITGSTYSGSGDWAIGVATVYTSETFTVFGSININGAGSLTLVNSILTIDESSQYEHAINIVAGFFKASHSTVKVSNDTGAVPLVQVNGNTGIAQLSNSTLKHIAVYTLVGGVYVDNCTMDSSTVEFDWGSASTTAMNITNNAFHNVTAGWVMTGFPKDSTINGNTIYSDCLQTYANGYFGWIANIASIGDNGKDITISNNHIMANVSYVGIYTNGGTPISGPYAQRIDIIHNTIDSVQRTWNATDHDFSIVAGIALYGYGNDSTGVWSNVDYNIIKRVDTNTRPNGSHLYGYSGFSMGISGNTWCKYWNINYNQIWYVGSAGVTHCFGIDYEGSHANIGHNNISQVRCQQGPIIGDFNTAGIIVENDYYEMFNTAYYPNLNAENCEYVNVTWNTISSVWSASNAITIGWSKEGGNVTLCQVSNNMIGDLQYMSVGIGIYIHVNHVLIADNTITGCLRDSLGISLCRDATNITVTRNSIHILATLPGSNCFPEEYTGAISLNAELYNNNGRDCIISYNHIVVDNRSIPGEIWNYPDYCVSNSSIATEGHELRIIVSELMAMRFFNSDVKVETVVDSMYAVRYWLNNVEVSSNYVNGSYAWRSSEVAQFKYLNTTLTYGPQITNMLGLVFIMFAIGIVVGIIAEGTKSLRKMQMRTTEQMVRSLLNMVIYIIIGIASLGVMYSIVA